jgi:hypothetical protein
MCVRALTKGNKVGERKGSGDAGAQTLVIIFS